MISGYTILGMTVEMLFVILLAAAMCIIIKKRYNTALSLFFLGGATFFVFAMVLEQILHSVMLLTGTMDRIQKNMYLYALYGGLAAGVFEEVGRFTVLSIIAKFCNKRGKQTMNKPENALMFGAGHGGFEAVLIIGSTMINNVVFIVMMMTGQIDTLLMQVPEAQQEALMAALDALKNSPAYTYYLGCLERVSAVILHIGLSALVWTAVVKKKGLLLAAAILIHALVDGVMVIIAGLGMNIFVVEAFILAASLIASVVSLMIWKKETGGVTASSGASD